MFSGKNILVSSFPRQSCLPTVTCVCRRVEIVVRDRTRVSGERQVPLVGFGPHNTGHSKGKL